jgi:anti-sigma factor RsiW
MKDWDPAELSALLDGELNSVRTKELEALIAADPGVRAEFERLELADRRLRAIVEAAVFRPELRWPKAAPAPRPARAWLALGFTVILLAWAAGKLAPTMTAALVVNAASLVLLLAGLAPFALREARSGAISIDPISGGPI